MRGAARARRRPRRPRRARRGARPRCAPQRCFVRPPFTATVSQSSSASTRREAYREVSSTSAKRAGCAAIAFTREARPSRALATSAWRSATRAASDGALGGLAGLGEHGQRLGVATGGDLRLGVGEERLHLRARGGARGAGRAGAGRHGRRGARARRRRRAGGVPRSARWARRGTAPCAPRGRRPTRARRAPARGACPRTWAGARAGAARPRPGRRRRPRSRSPRRSPGRTGGWPPRGRRHAASRRPRTRRPPRRSGPRRRGPRRRTTRRASRVDSAIAASRRVARAVVAAPVRRSFRSEKRRAMPGPYFCAKPSCSFAAREASMSPACARRSFASASACSTRLRHQAASRPASMRSPSTGPFARRSRIGRAASSSPSAARAFAWSSSRRRLFRSMSPPPDDLSRWATPNARAAKTASPPSTVVSRRAEPAAWRAADADRGAATAAGTVRVSGAAAATSGAGGARCGGDRGRRERQRPRAVAGGISPRDGAGAGAGARGCGRDRRGRGRHGGHRDLGRALGEERDPGRAHLDPVAVLQRDPLRGQPVHDGRQARVAVHELVAPRRERLDRQMDGGHPRIVDPEVAGGVAPDAHDGALQTMRPRSGRPARSEVPTCASLPGGEPRGVYRPSERLCAASEPPPAHLGRPGRVTSTSPRSPLNAPPPSVPAPPAPPPVPASACDASLLGFCSRRSRASPPIPPVPTTRPRRRRRRRPPRPRPPPPSSS